MTGTASTNEKVSGANQRHALGVTVQQLSPYYHRLMPNRSLNVGPSRGLSEFLGSEQLSSDDVSDASAGPSRHGHGRFGWSFHSFKPSISIYLGQIFHSSSYPKSPSWDCVGRSSRLGVALDMICANFMEAPFPLLGLDGSSCNQSDKIDW